ncbi:MAG: type II toxin-antitoxin system mRNA interferase toxin, RelE/StbE family [Methylococcales bacterium]|nr:type II toxin-antitoxin system mRNA interferase toxin, RelE/StbE family [Methylococcales bacterium]
MQLVRNESYQRKERKFFKKHVDLLDKYEQVLTKLKENPFDSSLKTHKLHGDLSEFHACSLTHNYRIVCLFLIQNGMIFLVDIGGHDDVY